MKFIHKKEALLVLFFYAAETIRFNLYTANLLTTV